MADQVLIATETGGYDVVPSAGWRKFKPTEDPGKTRVRTYEHRGIGDGGLADAEEVRVVEDGAEGPITLPAQSNGMGMLLRACASTATSDVVEDGEDAFVQAFGFGGDGAPTGTTLCTEATRQRRSGTDDVWRYSGGKPTQLTITQDKEGFVVFKFDVDYLRSERLGRVGGNPIVPRTPTIPDIALRYLMRDAQIRVKIVGDEGAGTARCFESFSLTIPLQLDVEDTCINRSVRRHEPSRNGVFMPTGAGAWKYDDPLFYDAFVSGELLEVVADWVGPVAIEDTTFPSLTVSLGSIRYTGDDPQVEVDARAKQDLPFECRSLGGADPVTIDLVTSDTGF